MFRGFRWQLLALIIAIVFFTASAVFRISRQTALPSVESRDGSVGTTATVVLPSPTTIPTSNPSASVDEVRPLEAAAPSNVFREGIVGGIQRLNPLFAHLNEADNDIASLIYEGLYAINEFGEAVPHLAAEVIISGDGTEYVVRLREDILWQDGIPFTAADVAYTMALLSDPAYADFSPASEFWRTVETQVLDERLLRFRLAQPYGSFPYLLTIGIVPEHALRGTTVEQLATHPFNLSPIGTGPYQLRSLGAALGGTIDEANLVLAPVYQDRPEANGGYFIQELQFRFFASASEAMQAWRANQVDALADIAPLTELLSLPQGEIYSQVDSALGVMIFNWQNELFTERRLRKALSLGLDIPGLVDRHFGSAATYADSPYVPGAAVYAPDQFWRSYDPSQAIALLDAAALNLPTESSGERSGESDSEPMPLFTLLVENRLPIVSLAADIVAGWSQLGLEVQVDAVSSGELLNRLETGRFDAAIVRQRIGANPDLFRFWHPAQYESGFNYGAASDTGIAETLEIARHEIYGFRRAELYEQFQVLFAEQVLAIPIFYPVYPYVVRDKFEGIELGYLRSGADRFRGLQQWRPATLAG